MAISLIIEDGSGKPNSNSYVGIDDAKEFATNRGIEFPSDDEIAVALIKACDFLEMKCFKGEKTNESQALAFPRTYSLWDENIIPSAVKLSQLHSMWAVFNGHDLTGVKTHEDYVILDKVGPLTTEYADPNQVGFGITIPMVDSLLSDFYCDDFGRLRTRRV